MWKYKEEYISEIPKGAISFTYKITRINIEEDNTSPIYYIGKKNFYRRSKRRTFESDWMSYYGSSEWLKEHVKKYGTENFEREILEICFSKSEATYKEVKLLIENDVLHLDYTSGMKKLYYNLSILGRYSTNRFFTKDDLNKLKSYRTRPDIYINRIAVHNGEQTKFLNTDILSVEEFLGDNPDWSLGTNIKGPNKDKVCCTDGIENIYIDKDDISSFLEENTLFYIGSKFKGQMIRINNGVEELRIYKTDIIPEGYTLGGLKKVDWTKKIRLINYTLYTTITIPASKQESYLNDGWEICPENFKISSFSRWVCNSTEAKKVKISEIEDYLLNGYELGRGKNYNTNKISVTKNNKSIFIDPEDIKKYIEDGYEVGGKRLGSMEERGLVYVSFGNKRKSIKKELLAEFLNDNPEWKEGYTPTNCIDTKNQVFVYDIKDNNKPLVVTPEEYKLNDNLVLRKTVELQKRKGLTKTEINRINKYYLEIYPRKRKIPTLKYKNKTTDKIFNDIDLHIQKLQKNKDDRKAIRIANLSY